MRDNCWLLNRVEPFARSVRSLFVVRAVVEIGRELRTLRISFLSMSIDRGRDICAFLVCRRELFSISRGTAWTNAYGREDDVRENGAVKADLEWTEDGV